MNRISKCFLLALFVGGTAVHAADIVWVHQSRGNHINSWEDDQWGEFLLDSGHNVIVHDRFDTIENLGDPSSIEQLELLNSGDLVIFSRDSNSGDYNNTEDELLAWTAGVQSPMIVMTPYVLRSSRWQMVNGTAIGDARNPLEALDPRHPFFSGVELDGNNQVDIWDPIHLDLENGDDNQSGYMDLIQVADVGNGEVVAVESGTDFPWIIFWDEGENFYDGSPTFAGGPRVFFGAGSDNDCCTWGAKNINPQGDQILLNIIDFLVPPSGEPCDFDSNGVCELADLDALLYIGLGSNEALYDLDGSGTVDLADRDEFLRQVGSFPGDFNLDGQVVAGDLNTLGGNWLQEGLSSYAQGDANGDGVANAADLNALGSNWQAGVPAAPVPEPSGYVGLLFGLLCLRGVQRNHLLA